MNDKISNAITKIRNAANAGKETTVVPFSSVLMDAISVMQSKGFVESFMKKGKKVAKSIEIKLSYEGDKPKITGMKRVSLPSKRIYRKTAGLRPVKNGYGYSIVSTSKGVMTGEEAKKEKVGGEVLFEIW